MQPSASSTTVPAGAPAIRGPTEAMTPSRTSTSASLVPVLSTTVPPLMITAAGRRGRGGPRSAAISGCGKVDPRAEQEVQHGHPDGDAIRDLADDHRVRKIGDFCG